MTHHQPRIAGVRKVRALCAVPLVAAALLSSAACSNAAKGEDPKQSPGAPESRSADRQDAERATVEKAYRLAWRERVKAYAKASSKGTKLQTYTTLDALRLFESEMLAMKKDGQVTTGKPELKPRVADLRLAEKIPTAVITDCTDISGWSLVHEKSKQEVDLPKERFLRYVSTAEMEKWGNQWKLTKLSPQEKRC